MILSKLAPFLAEEKVKTFKRALKEGQTFGLGVSWDKASQKIVGVSLIARDLRSLSSFKRFAASVEEKETVEFFDRLPMNVENPDDGLHGNIFALKIDARLGLKQAFYRRLGSTPVSLDGGEWYHYNYERFSPFVFSSLKFPKETSELFKIENKISFSGQTKGICIYPIYSKIKTLGKMSNGLEDYFDAFSNEILEDYPSILNDVKDIDSSIMSWVSFGEGKDIIKAYFVDFPRNRFLLTDI